jgi:histidine triad (HIT) family protein
VETLDDVPDDLLTPLFAAVRRMSVAMQKGLGADGSFVSVNTRISQSVPHVHVHVVPRRKGDGLFSTRIIWQRQKYASDTEASAIASRIRAAFDAAPV